MGRNDFMKAPAAVLAIAGIILSPALPAVAGDEPDLGVVHRIKQEAFKRSQVMDHLFQLTDMAGSRITGSPGHRRAAEWAIAEMKSWGLANAGLERWGDFGRGWSYRRLDVAMLEPRETVLHGLPLAWTAGTDGPVRGEVMEAPLFEEVTDPDRYDLDKLGERIDEYIEEHRGKLGGKVLLIRKARDFDPATDPPLDRYDAEELSAYARSLDPTPIPEYQLPLRKVPPDREERRRLASVLPIQALMQFYMARDEVFARWFRFLNEEGVKGLLAVDTRGTGGIIFAEELGSPKEGMPVPPPSVVLAPEEYNRIHRMLEKDMKVVVSIDLDASYHDDEISGMNVVAEIPGGARADEVVMVGAHLDSWHGATGATDNATGCATMMEAMRILKALDLDLDRTVRIALWGGEEQGILGSAGYVATHFGDPFSMKLKPGHEKLSLYLNHDNGGGRIRGVHLQGNDMARPLFEAWLRPFQDLGADTVTIRDTFGTDHLPFDSVGLPGFQFIQDPMDYSTRTHHSNMDHYDRVFPADLMQASAIIASLVYHAANREEIFPRKPLPEPLESGGDGGP